MRNQNIRQFYERWIAILPQIIEGYIYDENKEILPTRFIFSKFKKLIKRFLNDELDDSEKIILMPGIRGIGKSTLLTQIYSLEKFLNFKDDLDKSILKNISKLEEKIYIDVSQLKANQISLKDFFDFYQYIKGFNFVKPKKKILILIDEIHFDENWGLFLKNIFDITKGHKDILIIATGSSALQIKIIPDLLRRSEIWELFPMKFSEYLILKYKVYPPSNLSTYFQEALFNSNNAKEVYRKLSSKLLDIDSFFINNKIPPISKSEFFEYGSIPSVIRTENKQRALEKIKSIIDSVIVKDIINLKKFKTQTIAKVSDLLYLLAQSDVISYNKLKETLKIERIETLEKLLEVLVMSGILVKVRSYGRTYGAVRKTSKYLFIAPPLRNAILGGIYFTGIEGKKLEDYFALIFKKDLKTKLAYDLFYDIAEGGADFILTLSDRSNIVIEVGFNKEEVDQVKNTMKKVKSRYGLVFGSKKLELVNNSIVKVPLEFFLLI